MATIEKYALAGDVLTFSEYPWTIGTVYAYNEIVYNDGSSYRCRLAHTATATDEPGTGVNEATYWAIFCAGNAAIASSIITSHTTYQNGHHYNENDFCREAKSGYGYSWWRCILEHDGAANKNPTGSSGSTYWEEEAGGGQNGVSDINASLASIADITTALDADADKILTYNAALDAARWITADDFSQGYKIIEMNPETLKLPVTSPADAAIQVETPVNKHNFYVMGFPASGQKYATMGFDWPQGYNGGAILGYIDWYDASASNDAVCWGIQLSSVGDGETFDVAWGTAVEVVDSAQGGAWKRYRTPIFTNIVPSGTPDGGESCDVRIYRKPGGSDTLAATAYLTRAVLLFFNHDFSEA